MTKMTNTLHPGSSIPFHSSFILINQSNIPLNLNLYLCAVTNVSMNLRPSNLGANFSFSEGVILFQLPFFPLPVEQFPCFFWLKAPSFGDEEDVRATVEAASTEATKGPDLFIFSGQNVVDETRKKKGGDWGGRNPTKHDGSRPSFFFFFPCPCSLSFVSKLNFPRVLLYLYVACFPTISASLFMCWIQSKTATLTMNTLALSAFECPVK